MRAFHFAASPHAARAEDAAVVVEHIALVAHVYADFGEAVGIAYAVDAEFLRERLQLAVVVGNADRADMIALDKQQLDSDLTVALQLRRRGVHRHAFLHGRSARRQRASHARHLDDAEPAGAHRGEAFHVT